MRLVAKHAQVGYQTPGERPGCRNCKYGEVYRPEHGVCHNASRMTCTKYNLEITSGGICRTFDPRQGYFFDRIIDHQVAPPHHGEFDQVEHQTLSDDSDDFDDDALYRYVYRPEVDHKVVHHHGEFDQVGRLTKAQRKRALTLEIIKAEEASGDPELLRAAAFRRRSLRMEPRT